MFKLRQTFSSVVKQYSYRSLHVSAVSSSINATDSVSATADRPLNHGLKGVREDGGRIYQGFVYYPRHPEEKDPPYVPSKVYMVQRVRCLKKKPYWDKDVMKKLGLDGNRSEIAIVPNTPQYNALLFKVKHLIRITPVTFPQGIPNASDLSGARLQENGQLVFIPQLKKDSEEAEVKQIQETPSNHMDGETLRKHLRLNWIKPWK